MKAIIPGLILVGLLVLLAVSPLLPPGLPSIADAPIHLFRTMEMVSAWADGVYYPRWAPNLAFGYGYPIFNFAPPLPYFIAGAFHVLGFSLETSIKLLAVLCMAIYGFGMYLFVRNVLGERGALLAWRKLPADSGYRAFPLGVVGFRADCGRWAVALHRRGRGMLRCAHPQP
jgi:uncharacterized membrane protein